MRSLLVLGQLMTESTGERQILELAVTAVPVAGPVPRRVARRRRTDRDRTSPPRAPRPVGGPVERRTALRGPGPTRSAALRAGSGCSSWPPTLEPSSEEQFLLRALAQQTGARARQPAPARAGAGSGRGALRGQRAAAAARSARSSAASRSTTGSPPWPSRARAARASPAPCTSSPGCPWRSRTATGTSRPGPARSGRTRTRRTRRGGREELLAAGEGVQPTDPRRRQPHRPRAPAGRRRSA